MPSLPRWEKGGSNREAPHERGSTMKDHFVAMTGEFIGTFLFLYYAYAGHQMVANQASEQGPNGGNSAQTVVFISLCYGFSLLAVIWPFYRISGGLFNPAVTLAMVLSGTLPAIRGALLFPAQLLGSICAGALVQCMFPGDVSAVNTTLSPGTSIARGVFIEMFLTVILIFTVLMNAAEKSNLTPLAPLAIGISLFVAELAGVYFTGASLNPARSFGCAVAGAEFPGYHWIYWVGPFLGSLITAGYYRFIKYMNYEEANPDQDATRD